MFDGSLTVCYHLMNFPKHLMGGVNKHRIHPRTRSSSSALRSKPSSDMQAREKDDNLSELRSFELKSFPSGTGSCSPLFSLANTVGVIAGASAVSTLNFVEKLVSWSSEDGEESLPFIVCYDPVLSRELSSCERSSSLHLNSRSSLHLNSRIICSQFDHTPIVKNLRHKRDFLERSGARCIVMPCHISHIYHDEISEGSSVPFLHIGDCVAEELKAANLKPVETGSNLRIGILATDAVVTAGFYQEKLKDQGFEVLLPDKATMEHTVIPAIEAVDKGDMVGARNLLRVALQVFLVRAVNTVVLASDDLCGVLPRDDPLLKKCTDPMDALVRSTIRWAKSTGKNEHNT